MRFVLLPGITNIPLWAKPTTTIRDLFCRAADLQFGTQAELDLNRILDDPDYQPLLDQRIFQSGLLQGGVLNLFDPDRLINVIINVPSDAHRFQLPASSTVRQVKQQLKRQLASEIRNVSFDLLVTGSFDRPEGKTTLLALTRLPYQSICFDLVLKAASPIRTPPLRSVNEGLFRKHLQQDRFPAGVDQGIWRLVRIHWPNAVFAISAPVHDIPEQFVRFRLDDYPASPPAVELWDETEQRPLVHDCWPVWFKYFVVESYPHLITVDPAPYSPGLLKLSISIAAHRRHVDCDPWSPAGDITQCLLPMVYHFLSQPVFRKDADVQRRAIRRLVPQQQSA